MEESTLNELKNAIIHNLEQTEFCHFLELEFVELDDKFARGRIPFKKELCNVYGQIHGGILYSLADTVAGTLGCMNGRMVTTADAHMNFLDPVENTQYVYCEAKRVRCGKHLMVVKVKIRNDEGKLLDDGSFTFYRLKTSVLPQNSTE